MASTARRLRGRAATYRNYKLQYHWAHGTLVIATLSCNAWVSQLAAGEKEPKCPGTAALRSGVSTSPGRC